MTTMDSMIRRVRLEMQDSNLTTPDGEAESFDTVEDEDLELFIAEQLLFETHGRTDSLGMPYTLATMPDIEVPLLALLVAIQTLWVLANEAAREIDVQAGEGLTIRSSERFIQILQQIGQLQTRYNDLSEKLGVGLNRITMHTLRRVSQTTGRLVPIYKSQEYDDLTYPPVRVLPPIDSGLV